MRCANAIRDSGGSASAIIINSGTLDLSDRSSEINALEQIGNIYGRWFSCDDRRCGAPLPGAGADRRPFRRVWSAAGGNLRWLDQNCGADGWKMTPTGLRGVVNDAVAIYFRMPRWRRV
jgi:hypothetical protein